MEKEAEEFANNLIFEALNAPIPEYDISELLPLLDKAVKIEFYLETMEGFEQGETTREVVERAATKRTYRLEIISEEVTRILIDGDYYYDLFFKVKKQPVNRSKKVLTVSNIQPKPYKRNGVTHTCTDDSNLFQADIIIGQSIRIYGKTYQEEFDLTFKLGDQCVHGSYNLIYTGEIVSIGKKTVTIEDGNTKTRLNLYDFCRRNHHYDAARIERHNHEESQCI
ncbi:MAG: hypothetical protein KZQ70_09950 [gamma proteobacterium symbiont of Lucinoma myriamae]|nr:hypothetical protein [gamma proteobacterium symbiont of Lucinoma myriamae]MCU7819759.1 hypothetical protein [gamma proteobacterium symbiont of Lucinoma myriamae]